jgi:ABC-type phosphate transport system substrate-binding protein
MKTPFIFIAIAGLLFAGCLCIARPGAAAPDDEVDVVVNKANSVNALSLGDARKIFMGDKTVWQAGQHIRVLMLAPGVPERAVVLRQIYKMTEADYTRYFLQAAFTGKIEAPPKDLDSTVQMKQFLSANPGAIGYLKKNDADDSVKIVLRLPVAPGNP